MGKSARSVILNLVATAVWEFGRWVRNWLTHPITWGWIVGGLTSWWAQASALDGPTIFIYSLVAASSVVYLTGKIQQWWRQRTGGVGNALEPELVAKNKEIAELKESIRNLTKSRRQTAAEVLVVEDHNKVANISKEEKIRRDEEWIRAMPPPDLTGETVTVTISFLQRIPTKAPIKIVSTPEYTEWAKGLVTIFRLSGFEVMVNPKATEGIFSAKVKHDRLVLRFPTEDEPKTYDGKQRHLKYHALSLMPVFMGFEVAHFDSSSGIDYFQVEIKGAP